MSKRFRRTNGSITGLATSPEPDRLGDVIDPVEPIDVRVDVLTVPVESEETGRTERVKKWGLRVDERTFNAVASAKKDDGIIQRDSVGAKRRGALVPEYELPTTGAAITQW